MKICRAGYILSEGIDRPELAPLRGLSTLILPTLLFSILMITLMHCLTQSSDFPVAFTQSTIPLHTKCDVQMSYEESRQSTKMHSARRNSRYAQRTGTYR